MNKKYMLSTTTVVVLLWWVVASFVDNPVKIPSPLDTLHALSAIVMGKYFLNQMLYSLVRILIGFSISFLLAIILGMIAGFSNPVYYVLKPIVLTQRAVPTMAVILLSLIWLSREHAPILVGSLVIFPIIYSSVVNSVRSVDVKLIEMATLYQLDFKRKLLHLYLPSMRSALASVSSAALSLNIKVNIAAEVLSQPKFAIGTGFQMEKVALNTAGVFAWAIIAIIIASVFEWLLNIAFSKWR